MNAQEQLISKFYEGLLLHIGLSIAFTLLIIILLWMKSSVLERLHNYPGSKLVLYCVLGVLAVVNLIFILQTHIYVSDLNYINNGDFSSLDGVVVGYNRGEAIGDIVTETRYYDPIILKDGTGERIVLKVVGTELNEHYTFLYLPNTKLAVIIENS